MIELGLLLEEMIEPLDAELLKRNKRKAQLSAEAGVSPANMYTITYFKDKKVVEWACVAHGWDWKDRHKRFYLVKPEGGKEYIAEFYCDKKDFISQQARLVM